MRNVVLVPCWKRAELLWHTLQHIIHAEGADQLHYIFRMDTGHSPELHEVVRNFPFSHEVAMTPRTTFAGSKQSFSLLSGYKLAAERSGKKVFMIEEDVFIASDFFRWHYAVHESHPDLFCSIAVRNPNGPTPEGAHDTYYLSSGDYCSLGVCFDRTVLTNLVEPHATAAYYVEPTRYCRRNFPGAPINPTHTEQDGLIRRIQWQRSANNPIAYPCRAKAYHAGYYGANRAKGPSGTLAQRIEHVGQVCYSTEAMRTFALNPAYFEDSTPVDLNAESWQHLKMIPLDMTRNPLRL
jgi:hypothetical protein